MVANHVTVRQDAPPAFDFFLNPVAFHEESTSHAVPRQHSQNTVRAGRVGCAVKGEVKGFIVVEFYAHTSYRKT